MLTKEPRVLFYDLETSYLQAKIWRLGEQRIRHDQLAEDRSMYNIICLTYCWNDGQPAGHFDWGFKEQNSRRIIEEFDKLVNEADIVIGKNNKKFDDKHINTQRLLHGLPPMPNWTKKSDDLERQMRKHFGTALPSQSLDYISKLLGFDGKISMKLQDWVDIIEKKDILSFQKMINYGKKDVEDTRAIWYKVVEHITPRFTISNPTKPQLVCSNCSSKRLQNRGSRVQKSGVYRRHQCQACGTWGATKINDV